MLRVSLAAGVTAAPAQEGRPCGRPRSPGSAGVNSAPPAAVLADPLGNVNAVGIRIGGRYIRYGDSSWIAFINAPAVWGEPVFCVHA